MGALKGLSETKRKELQSVAMHKLIPPAARNLKEIPITIAGKIKLAKYSNGAIKYGIKYFNRALTPLRAFQDLVRIAEQYRRVHNEDPNNVAVSFLINIYDLEDGPLVEEKASNRPELIPWESPVHEENDEPLYISYFKLKDHLESKKLNLPNPYRGKFSTYMSDAISTTGISREKLEAELYQMYLKQKEQDDVHSLRETDTTPTTTVLNTQWNQPSLRSPERPQTRVTQRTETATRLF